MGGETRRAGGAVLPRGGGGDSGRVAGAIAVGGAGADGGDDAWPPPTATVIVEPPCLNTTLSSEIATTVASPTFSPTPTTYVSPWLSTMATCEFAPPTIPA